MATPADAVSALLAGLPDLEACFDPLHKQDWAETMESLSTIERAKMDVLLSYAINDLIWVYLKLKGIDPAEHEVTPELERIKGYYSKIRQAEEPEAQRSSTIDKAAAGRFIAAAIPLSQRIPADGGLPSTSAAALAQRQAKAAVAEQRQAEEQDQGGRMASRFRFIAGESARFSVSRSGSEAASGDEPEEHDQPEGDANAETEEFMRDLDEEIKAKDVVEIPVSAKSAHSSSEEVEQVEEEGPKRKKRRNRSKAK